MTEKHIEIYDTEGTKYQPRTLSTEVIMADGSTVEAKIAEMQSGGGGKQSFEDLLLNKGYMRTTVKTSTTVYMETIVNTATGKTAAKRVTTKNSSAKYTEVITMYQEDGTTVKETITTVTTKSGTTYTEVVS